MFWDIQNNLKIRHSYIISDAFWKFLSLGSSALDFLGFIFWSKDFFGALIFDPFDHPCHLKSEVAPSPLCFCDLFLFQSDRMFEAISQSVVSAYFDSARELWTKKLVSSGGHMRPFFQTWFLGFRIRGCRIFSSCFCLSVYLTDRLFVCFFSLL